MDKIPQLIDALYKGLNMFVQADVQQCRKGLDSIRTAYVQTVVLKCECYYPWNPGRQIVYNKGSDKRSAKQDKANQGVHWAF